MDPKRSGKPGRYFKVLNWLSEYGLSFETWGRLWVLVMPKSLSKNATDLEVIDGPQSAWMVSAFSWIFCGARIGEELFGELGAFARG